MPSRFSSGFLHQSLPQLAVGGGWTTNFTLINRTVLQVQASGLFQRRRSSAFCSAGVPPIAVPAGPLLAVTLDRTLSANAQVVMESTAPDNAATLVGAGELLGNGVERVRHLLQSDRSLERGGATGDPEREPVYSGFR